MKEYRTQQKLIKTAIQAISQTDMKPLKISTSIRIRSARDENVRLKCILSLPDKYVSGLDSKELEAVSSQLSDALDDLLQIAITGLTKTR